MGTICIFPINLTFFVRSTPAKRVLALYPSPAGAVESLLTLEAWQALVDQNPVLGELEPDVEALLVNRMKGERALLSCTDRRMFQAGRSDPNALARAVGRHGGLGRSRSVLHAA